MANKILPFYDAGAALTITIAGLASSTAGVGRQSTMVDNSTTRYKRVRVFVKIKLGTSPTSAKAAYIYILRGDKNATPHRTDGAGASDAALTVLNAKLLGVLGNKTSGAATGDVLQDDFILEDPGPEWGIAIVHDTVAALDATGSNHWARYIGEDPEVQ
jgi:hypothetical protein